MPRVTNIITSINSDTAVSSESVTIDSTSWFTDNGTITLSATVPAATIIGDIIEDSATNSYLITGISGAVLTCQDFDTTTDPVTGASTIQGPYTTLILWEADLDDTNLYVSSDDAIGEMYNNGAFDETVLIDGGSTVGLNLRILTVPLLERHDGTAGTGARIVRTGSGFAIDCAGNSDKTLIEWLEIDMNGNGNQGLEMDCSTTISATKRSHNLLIHGVSSSGNVFVYGIRTSRGSDAANCIIYDISNTGNNSKTVHGIRITSNPGQNTYYVNLTIHNIVKDNGTGGATCMRVQDDADHIVKNNIGTDAGGSGSGTIIDFTFDGTNPDSETNLSSDTSADDGGGSGHLLSRTSANQFVSTTPASEDLHLKSGADAIDAGTDLGTTPTGVQFDIDNRDRDAEGDVWDIGADEFVADVIAIPFINAGGSIHGWF